MKTSVECIPCFVRQTLDSVRRVTEDGSIHEQVLRETLRAISTMDLRRSPPSMVCEIQRFVRKMVSAYDPYRKMKDKSNRVALRLYPDLKFYVDRATYPVETAIRLAISGNVIDAGVNNGEMDKFQVGEVVQSALTTPICGDAAAFYDAVLTATDILYLADNAGEIVFDRLLLEQMPMEKVTVAVRGAPVLNDATIEDAHNVGIDDLVEVIDNGSDAPGTILEECSDTFRNRFDKADLVIAKGQGNYETLSEAEKDIFFLLKVKCPLIAVDTGFEVGSLVLHRSNYVPAEPEKKSTFC